MLGARERSSKSKRKSKRKSSKSKSKKKSSQKSRKKKSRRSSKKKKRERKNKKKSESQPLAVRRTCWRQIDLINVLARDCCTYWMDVDAL